jgi:phage tail sheath protein FI
MPATLTAPGLYLRRAETPPPRLGSAITGFVGMSERGPINSPQPLTGWSDYLDTFGSFVPFGYLAQSVFSFFRNGGEKCWVVRAADTSRIGATTPAGQCVQSAPLATASASFADHNGTDTVRVLALDPGGWGDKLEVRVGTSELRPLRIGTLTQATTALTTQLEISSILDLRPGLRIRITDPDGVSNGTERVIASGATALNLTTRRVEVTAQVDRVFPIGSVVYAPGFRIEAEFRDRRELFDPVSMRADDPRYFPSVINAPATMTDYGERRRRGFSSLITVEHVPSGGASRFRPADTTSRRTLAGGDDGFTQARETFRGAGATPLVTIVAKGDRGSAGNGLQVIATPFLAHMALPSPDAGGAKNRVVVDDISGFQAGEPVRVGVSTSTTSEIVTPSLVVPDGMMLQLPGNLTQPHEVGEPVTVADRFTLEARRLGAREPVEVIRNLSGNTTGARRIRPTLQSESTLLCANEPPAAFTTPILTGATSASITLAGGADPGAMDARYYTGYQNDGSYFAAPGRPAGSLVGLATLELVEEISLVSVPDVTRVATTSLAAAQTSILRHCARLGDRFALLDAPAVVAPATFTTEDWVRSLGNAELRKFGAAFHPWVWGTFEEIDYLTPPSGAVAGLIARTDATLGVNKAPANERLEGVFGLEPAIDRKRHGELNPLGVNCVAKLEDGEICLMGSRTLSDDAVARYISVRRTILSVKKTLAQRMLWAVFEPIGDALFRRLEATLVTYLQARLARGVTASQRPGDAFFVRCNADTNPPEQQRLGIVVAEVGLALLAPAEFIVLTVRRTPDALQVIEEDA